MYNGYDYPIMGPYPTLGSIQQGGLPKRGGMGGYPQGTKIFNNQTKLCNNRTTKNDPQKVRFL